ncbi:DM13 domain-containing protein [Brasilonema sp. UFV-L1]|uniref:DM13 domain-containing protein n=1 Tax=Brasilonema sp. UFV-L1 TaxID=2234130 RepID=UPI00145EE2BA|nr:DM13 domain-containing protein [Brasilonema sp. UFV-L1]NMG07597.1 permease [Brasilonema sp. UFV-L1]
MKLNQLVQLGVISSLACFLSVGTVKALTPSARISNSPVTNAHSKALIAQKQQIIAASGTFVKAEQPTSGTAQIVTENGQQYLVLDSSFQTSNQGPDLHVLLDSSEKPPAKYQNLSSYVNLGKLQKFKGTQRYPIPTAINLSNFKSAVIWCRMANATFGYAPLRSGSSGSY